MIQFIKRMLPVALLFFIGYFVKAQSKDMYIVLLAGQSNMAGRGVLRPAIDTVSYDNIFSLNKDSVWVRAKNPLHWDKAEAAVGMGITFAHELALKLGGNVKIGLVPCAAGGTNIDQWLNNEYFGYTGKFNLYTNLISRARRAAKDGTIVGMIWHQGESDASTARSATYKDKLNTFFQKVRTDLKSSNLPIVAGELGTYLANNPTYPRWDSINSSINQLKRTLPHYDVVSSAGGLTCNTDITHFTSESQNILGLRYAEAFYKLTFGTSVVENVTNTDCSLRVFQNQLHVSFNIAATTQLKIYTLQGELVKSILIRGQDADIDLQKLKGVYIALIQNDGWMCARKLVL